MKEKAIRIVGKPLGRPPKEKLNAYQKRKLKKERNQRNLIEGKFGQGKNAYGLKYIKAKRSDTSESWIGAIFFVMNLVSLMKIADIYAIFCAYLKNQYYTAIARLFGSSTKDLTTVLGNFYETLHRDKHFLLVQTLGKISKPYIGTLQWN